MKSLFGSSLMLDILRIWWYSPCIMCVQYIGGCSVHREVFSTLWDIMSTSGGCSLHRGDIMMHVGDIMSTSGDFQYISTGE